MDQECRDGSILAIRPGKSARMGLPDDLAAGTVALLVVGRRRAGLLEGVEEGDVILLVPGRTCIVYRTAQSGVLEVRMGEAPPARWDIVGILRKFQA